jgi:hypothetical protein
MKISGLSNTVPPAFLLAGTPSSDLFRTHANHFLWSGFHPCQFDGNLVSSRRLSGMVHTW